MIYSVTGKIRIIYFFNNSEVIKNSLKRLFSPKIFKFFLVNMHLF